MAVEPFLSPSVRGGEEVAQMKKKAFELFICAVIVLCSCFIKAR